MEAEAPHATLTCAVFSLALEIRNAAIKAVSGDCYSAGLLMR